ncbi:DUF1653 domain-containing protein [Candidatus Peribacteria bacterium]|nr:DUF1653 domain-containing protein [Candidatus Peribacteria bacterium]
MRETLPALETRVVPGTYRHYKGRLYEVIGMGHHSETLEVLVFYRSLAEGTLWARPASMWSEMVEWEGQQCRRFTRVEE